MYLKIQCVYDKGGLTNLHLVHMCVKQLRF